jgi:hypothetical protein
MKGVGDWVQDNARATERAGTLADRARGAGLVAIESDRGALLRTNHLPRSFVQYLEGHDVSIM